MNNRLTSEYCSIAHFTCTFQSCWSCFQPKTLHLQQAKNCMAFLILISKFPVTCHSSLQHKSFLKCISLKLIGWMSSIVRFKGNENANHLLTMEESVLSSQHLLSWHILKEVLEHNCTSLSVLEVEGIGNLL